MYIMYRVSYTSHLNESSAGAMSCIIAKVESSLYCTPSRWVGRWEECCIDRCQKPKAVAVAVTAFLANISNVCRVHTLAQVASVSLRAPHVGSWMNAMLNEF